MAKSAIAIAVLLASSLLAGPANAADEAARARSDVILSVRPAEPVRSTASPLNLTAAQRSRIAEVLAGKNTEIDLNMKEHKDAQSFEPKIGDNVPKDLVGEAFPQPLITEMPAIRQYTYLKFKGQLLIVDPMTKKIVDTFPEQNG